MQFRFQRIFRNEQDEIAWLNKMAEEGLILVKKAPLTYFFKFSEEEEKYYYKIVYMHDAVENGASDEEIRNLPDDGSVLICGYKNRAYLLNTKNDFANYNDSNARYKHFIAIWSFYLISFFVTLSIFAYHFDYALKMIIEENPIPSIWVVSLSAVALIISSVLFSYYLDRALVWKNKSKTLISNGT